jgi:hypothetical protein
MGDEKDFADFCKKRDQTVQLMFEQIIDESENEFGQSHFTESCREQLGKKKMLTDKQIARLKSGPPESDYYPDHYYD